MNKILVLLVAIAATITVNAGHHGGHHSSSSGGTRSQGSSNGGSRSQGGMHSSGGSQSTRSHTAKAHAPSQPSQNRAPKPSASLPKATSFADKPHSNPPSKDRADKPHSNPPSKDRADKPHDNPTPKDRADKPHDNHPPKDHAHKPHGHPPTVIYIEDSHVVSYEEPAFELWYSNPPPNGPIVYMHPRFGWPAEWMQGWLISPPSRFGFHQGRPEGALFWECPQLPPVLPGAVRGWEWVKEPWYYIVEGVYYYGEGYYFDGYNYCYNGGFYLCPPPTGEAFNLVETALQ